MTQDSSCDMQKRALEMFERASELPEREQAAFLDDHAADDPQLRAFVERMLQADRSDSTSSLHAGFGADLVAAAMPPAHPTPGRVGRYRIVREIGRGGMGVVYEAHQESPSRRVAVKVIREGALSGEVRQRFAREANLLGRFRHPGIASIIEAGIDHIDGIELPYFAMEYLDARPLDAHIREVGLDRRGIVILFERICDAVQHAHQNGVIHRDLKPSNILVVAGASTVSADGSRALNDSIGQPKILDFGIARLVNPSDQASTLQTREGQLIGTLAYMAPEQVAGDSLAIDTRSDIYAIGVMLHTALAGSTPLDLHGKPIPEAARIVRDETPATLSSADPTLRGDLEVIVATAMDKDPERRYQSAAALAEDLRRHRADEPIAARPPSTLYQLSKFASRNRALVAGFAASLVLLVAGVAGTSIGLASALSANTTLTQRNEQLERVSSFQATRLADLDLELMASATRGEIFRLTDERHHQALEDGLANVNFTTVMLGVLEESLLADDIERIGDAFGDLPVVRAQLLSSLAATLNTIGLHERALESAEDAGNVLEEHAGPDDPRTLRARAAAASILTDLGRFDEAESQLSGIVERLESEAGASHPSTLEAKAELAEAIWSLGREDEAAAMLESAVDELRKQFGVEHDATLDALGTLATVYDGLGRDEEAIELFELVLSTRESTLGNDHPQTIRDGINLVFTLDNIGEYTRAEALARRMTDASSRVLGENHVDAIRAAGSLAWVLESTGRYDEARPLRRSMFERAERSLGRDNSRTITYLTNYAYLLGELAEFEDAARLYRESIERFDRTLGPDHPRSLAATGNLAGVLAELGRDDESLQLTRDVYESFFRIHGDEHPFTLTALGNLASRLQGLGRSDEAEPLYRDSLETSRRVLGDDHPSTLNAMYNLGNVLVQRGRLDEAEPYCVEALDRYRTLGSDHPGTLYCLGVLGDLRARQGRFSEAQALFSESLEGRQRVFGPDHPATQQAADQLEAANERLRQSPGA